MHHVISDVLTSIFVLLNKFDEQFDQNLLDLTGHHLAALVFVVNIVQLGVVFQKECEPLITHIDVNIGTQSALFLSTHFTTRKCMVYNLVLDLFGRVSQKYGRVLAAGAHFSLVALKSWEEFAVNQCGLQIAKARSNVASHTEIRILRLS